jgi:hypothetical protein
MSSEKSNEQFLSVALVASLIMSVLAILISGLHLYYKWTHEADTLLCPNDVSVEMCYSPPNDGGYKSDDYSFPGETTDIPIPPQEPIGRPGVKPPPQSWPTPPPTNSGGPEGF